MKIPTTGRCETGKRRFNKLNAQMVVARATMKERQNPRTSRQEARAYRCPKCRGWHTTSEAY